MYPTSVLFERLHADSLLKLLWVYQTMLWRVNDARYSSPWAVLWGSFLSGFFTLFLFKKIKMFAAWGPFNYLPALHKFLMTLVIIHTFSRCISKGKNRCIKLWSVSWLETIDKSSSLENKQCDFLFCLNDSITNFLHVQTCSTSTHNFAILKSVSLCTSLAHAKGS